MHKAISVAASSRINGRVGRTAHKLQEVRSELGVLPDAEIRELVRGGAISAGQPLAIDQVQPASIDLRLGATAHRVRASFLPGTAATVEERLDEFTLHEISLANGAVLETGCVYIIPLEERLSLPPDVAARANPKSSTGRLDVFTRLICDRGDAFDVVPNGYNGRLYAEVSPRTFGVLVRQGSRLNQLRLRRGNSILDDARLRKLHSETPVSDNADPIISQGLAVRVSLVGAHNGLVGFRARRHAGVIDVDRVRGYEVLDYWDPLFARGRPELVLDPNEFYILASKETVRIPHEYAAEMVPFDPMMGEFRVHYAGFFDPGFGMGSDSFGSRAVLEVRSHEVPFLLEDGQLIGRLVFEKLGRSPDRSYGTAMGSNYQSQGLNLSKHFKPFNYF